MQASVPMSTRRVSPDVDQGWAFVVMFTGILCQLLTLGVSFTASIFYSILLEVFEESPVLTAWAVNLNSFILFCSGELSNIIMNFCGKRATLMIGCMISTLGLISCSFANNLIFIFLLYGVVTGVGYGCFYFPVFPIITEYFQKYRILAFGFISLGTGLGQFIFPPLIQFVNDKYTWRGVFLILGAINLNMLVMASVAMPKREDDVDDTEQTQAFIRNEKVHIKSLVTNTFKQRVESVRLFRNPRWMLFCIGLCLINIGVSCFFTHIRNYGLLCGLKSMRATLLATIIGTGNICGRITAMIISQTLKLHVVAVFMFFLFFVGVADIMCTFLSTFVEIGIASAIVGFAHGAYAVFPEAIIHVVGVRRLSDGISYAMAFSGAGMMSGGSFAAFLHGIDPTYRLSFMVIGTLVIIGSLCFLPSWLTYENGRIKERKRANDAQVHTVNL